MSRPRRQNLCQLIDFLRSQAEIWISTWGKAAKRYVRQHRSRVSAKAKDPDAQDKTVARSPFYAAKAGWSPQQPANPQFSRHQSATDGSTHLVQGSLGRGNGVIKVMAVGTIAAKGKARRRTAVARHLAFATTRSAKRHAECTSRTDRLTHSQKDPSG